MRYQSVPMTVAEMEPAILKEPAIAKKASLAKIVQKNYAKKIVITMASAIKNQESALVSNHLKERHAKRGFA